MCKWPASLAAKAAWNAEHQTACAASWSQHIKPAVCFFAAVYCVLSVNHIEKNVYFLFNMLEITGAEDNGTKLINIS